MAAVAPDVEVSQLMENSPAGCKKTFVTGQAVNAHWDIILRSWALQELQ